MTAALRITNALIMNAIVLFSGGAYAFCFEEAGREFDVSVPLLKAICFTESSMRPGAINHDNSNETVDYGLCQINSWWLKKLEPMGITEETLLTDPCENTRVSAWILSQNFATSGEGWLAVGAYNAGYKNTPEKEAARQQYIALVKENMESMAQ
jgi:soluble lytic murein transglycosylase-like protein